MITVSTERSASRAFDLRRVAGPNGDRRCHVGVSVALRDLGDSCERRAEIALDVDCKRLERRHVQHATALRFCRLRRKHQPVETRQERRQRLAAARRRQDQRRFTPRDRGPAECLRSSRRGERGREPRADRRMKQLERFALQILKSLNPQILQSQIL
jgi:hypothetical protein